MTTLFETVSVLLKEKGWNHNQIDDSTIRIEVLGDEHNWVAFAKCIEDPPQFLFYSIPHFKVPEGKRHSIAEFFTRVNYGLKVGNFELDYRDGEVRYKTSIHFVGDSNRRGMIEQAIYTNIITMGRYLSGIMTVMYSDTPVEEVIKQVEHGKEVKDKKSAP